MIINHNISALNANRMFSGNVKSMENKMEKLASGFRINKGSDDAAGLAVSEKMRAQVRGLGQASRNLQDGASLIQTAEGFLKESNDVLQRVRELSVQAANGTYTNEDRAQITVEIDEMVKELNRVHEDAKFNTMRLLDGKTTGFNSFGIQGAGLRDLANGTVNPTERLPEDIAAARNVNFNVTDTTGMNGVVIQSGANTDERMFVKLDEFNSFSLGLTAYPTEDPTNAPATMTDAVKYSQYNNSTNANVAWREKSFFEPTALNLEAALYLESPITPSAKSTGGAGEVNIDLLPPFAGNRVDVSSSEKATETIAVLDVALNKVNKQRADLGAFQNRIEMATKGVDNAAENLQATESLIRDADMAAEMVDFTKNQILAQSAASMTSQANMSSQLVMKIIG
jgi:flagellin